MSLGLALALAGCAGSKTVIIGGQEVPRIDLELTGQPYSMRHERAHPRPGAASGGVRGDGGSVRGRVCGMFADLDVTHRGDHVQIVGSLDNGRDVSIAVSSDAAGQLHLTGNLGTLGVDFIADPTKIEGHVGLRVFAMDREGDLYRGYMHVPGLLLDGRMGVSVSGAAALWSMPPADIAAVLPALMTCDGFQRKRIVSALHVGVGGRATDAPSDSSSLYSHGR